MTFAYNSRNTRFGLMMSLFFLLYVLAGGYGTAKADGQSSVEEQSTSDHLEDMNRVFYGINDILDKAFLEPLAEAYVEFVPGKVRTSVSNFFDNLAYLGVILNDVLQGKVGDAFKDSGRFAVNSTIGIGGLFDPATSMGLERHEEDFGQTLGVWGAGEGAYLVLPGVGSSSVRDVPGLAVGFFTNLLYYVESSALGPLVAFQIIDHRASLLDFSRQRDESFDPYVFTRDVYRQRQTHLIHDGDTPLEMTYQEEF